MTVEKNVPFDEYRAWAGLNCSLLKVLLNKTPAHFKWRQNHPSSDTASMKLGRLTHAMVFTPDDLGGEYIKYEGVRRGKKWEAFQEENEGKEIVTVKEYAEAEQIAVAVHESLKARDYITGGDAEVSLRFNYCDLGCKARLDYLKSDCIVDLKTTSYPASSDSFLRECLKYGYDLQAAFYQRAAYEVTGEQLPFFFVVVETVPPFLVNVVKASDQFISHGHEALTRCMNLYKECKEAGEWPGYGNMVEEIRYNPETVKEIRYS